jgi:hydroxymethylbilane synthase
VFVPAVGQGCVAVECRADDPATTDALAAVDDLPTRFAVSVERAFLAELGAGCSLPLGAHCTGGRLYGYLAGAGVGDPGSREFRESLAVPEEAGAAAELAAAMARRARDAAAA